MTVVNLFCSPVPALAGGLTHEQAMEIHRRFHDLSQAAPTIAHEMGVKYEAVCQALSGKVWPGAYQFWMDRVLP